MYKCLLESIIAPNIQPLTLRTANIVTKLIAPTWRENCCFGINTLPVVHILSRILWWVSLRNTKAR